MKNKKLIKKMVTLGILGSLVACLSLIKIPLGQFSITLALIPLVVGAILYGPIGGAFLGLVMGIVILFVDAAYFYAFNPFGTIIVVIVKSTVAGVASGLLFNLLKNKNKVLAIILATIIAPIVNTGIFFIGCYVFFYPLILENAGSSKDVFMFIILSYIGLNFVVEFLINCILAPTVVYLINKVAKNFNLETNI